MEDTLLTKQEAAKFLKVSPSAIDSYRKAGLPSYKVGRKVLLKQADIMKALTPSKSQAHGQ
jgi:excisionase family DNA binding protein